MGEGTMEKKVPIGSTYEIVWNEGPLGLTIDVAEIGREEGTNKKKHVGAYIKRMANKGVGLQLDESNVGDRIVSISRTDVENLSFDLIVAILRKVQKPCVLEIKSANHRIEKNPSRRGSRSRPNSSGSVGPNPSLHKQSSSGSGHSSSRGASGGRRRSSKKLGSLESPYDVMWTTGSLGIALHAGASNADFPYIKRLTGGGAAASVKKAQVGDRLVAVNGESVRGRPFLSLMETIQSLPKPIVLKFQPGIKKSRSDENLARPGDN